MPGSGAILRLDANSLIGWARLTGSCAPAVVEVLADGVSVAYGCADLAICAFGRVVAADLPATARHAGFVVPLSSEIVRHARRIEARIANVGYVLEGTLDIDLHPCLRWTDGLLGQVVSDGGARLSGWVLDPRRPLEIVRLKVFVDGAPFGTIRADRPEPFLAKRAIGSGFSGFELFLPLKLLDGRPHMVALEDVEGRGPVPGSPVEIRHLPSPLSDFIDDPGARAIARWYDFRFFRELPNHVRAEIASKRAAIEPGETGLSVALAGEAPAGSDGAQNYPNRTRMQDEADVLVRIHGEAVMAPDAFSALVLAFREDIDLVSCDYLIDDPLELVEFERVDPLRWAATGLPPLIAWRRRTVEAGGRPVGFALDHPARCRHLALALVSFSRKPDLRGTPLGLPAFIRGRERAGEPARLKPAERFAGLVSIVIPSRDRHELLESCIGSIRDAHQPHEIIVVDNGSREEETFALHDRIAEEGVRILRWDKPFNFSDLCNFGAENAEGDALLFLNNDVVFPGPDWIAPLVSWLTLPGVGAVGNKLVWPNDVVQHGGVRIGPQGLADHIGTTWRRDEAGPHHLNDIPRFVDAVTAACLAMPAELFRRLNGFDGNRFAVAFNDVDLCLRITEAGHRILWTPEPWAYHLESASRGDDDLPHKRARMEREAEALRHSVHRWRRSR